MPIALFEDVKHAPAKATILAMKWLRLGLEVIGALSLAAVAILVVLMIREWKVDKVNAATKSDALFILNWGGISTNQDFKVIASYRSSRNITGDHLDYYCLELPRFEIAEPMKDEWHDGPETNPLLAGALELAINSAKGHGDCLPSAEKANSETMKIMFWRVVLYGRQATAADILLYESKTKRLYYVSFKT